MWRKIAVTFIAGLMITIYCNFAVLSCPSPKVISLSVNQGVNTGPVDLIVTGSQFHKSVFVKLTKEGQSDILATNVKILSKTQIACTLDLRDKAAGRWDVVVGNIGTFTKKEKPTKLVEGFTITYPTPVVSEINPKEGLNNTTVRVTLTGSNFRPGIVVILNGQKLDIGAADVKLISDTELQCSFDLSGVSAGVYNVKVVNEDGQTGLAADSFTVKDSPVTIEPTPTPTPVLQVLKISPESGFNNGSIMVDVRGVNIDPAASIKLSGNGTSEIVGENVKVTSPQDLQCFFDLTNQQAGNYDVIITNPDGNSSKLAGAFKIEQFETATNLNKLLKPIYFDFDKANLREDQIAVIDVDLKVLKENSKLFILLGGHADERGTREYNLRLSAMRAETIKQYICAQGIDPERIVTYAYGKDYPLKKGHGEEFWQYERRVDILVWETPPTKEQGIPKNQ